MDAEKRLTQILTELGNVAPAILSERQQRIRHDAFFSGTTATCKTYAYQLSVATVNKSMEVKINA